MQYMTRSLETRGPSADYMKQVVCHFLVSVMDKSRHMRAPLAAAALLMVLATGTALSQQTPGGRILATGSHTVHLGVAPITVLAVSGNPVPLILDRTMYSGSTVLRDESTFYNLTSNVDNVLIEVSLDRPMPKHMRLAVFFASTLGRSSGWVDVTRGGRETVVVSGMSRGLENGQTISYRLEIDGEVQEKDLENRLLTITLVDPVSRQSHTAYQSIQFGVIPGL